ncbi:MAG TPA: hypothetical protein VM145_01300 [Sphingomicrobium sp.]|nr:hypothetical protein [Sphingomicrobium sp.]
MFHAKIDRRAERDADPGCVEPRAWWQTRAAALILVLVAAIPLIYPPTLPLVDVPGHMARYRVELDLQHSTDLQRYFTFNWALIGNLGVDVLIIPLGKLFGLELATRLIALSIPALTVAGFLAVAGAVHRRVPATALFALPLAYSQPMSFGFLNYALSMALALLAFAWWLRLTQQSRFRARAATFAPLSILLFFVHAYGWAFFCLLAFTSELVRARAAQPWLRATGNAVRDCLPLSLPVLFMAVWRAGSHVPSLLHWSPPNVKAFWLIGIFRYNNRPVEMAFAFFILCAVPILLVRLKARPSGFMLATSGALLAAFLTLPWMVFGSAFADMRLAPYVVAIAILAFGASRARPATANRIAIAACAVYAAFLVGRTVQFAEAAKDQQLQLAALTHIPTGASVVSLVGSDCRNVWDLPVNSHLGSYVTTRRRGFSNDQWLTPGASLLALRGERKGYFTMDPSEMVFPKGCPERPFPTVDRAIARVPTDPADYLWLIDIQSEDARLLEGWRQVWRYRDSALYRRVA